MQTTNFEGHPDGYAHFEPANHFTLKVREASHFRACWERLRSATVDSGFVGYLEAEFIAVDEAIPEVAWTPGTPPFHVSRRRLRADQGERFRQSEVHLTLDRDRSHPALIKRLLDAGLYGAYLPKAGRTDLVLTAQGSRTDVATILAALRKFLSENGGAVGASIKEERVVDFELHGVEPAELPEVIACVDVRA